MFEIVCFLISLGVGVCVGVFTGVTAGAAWGSLAGPPMGWVVGYFATPIVSLVCCQRLWGEAQATHVYKAMHVSKATYGNREESSV